jgi:hypothetical protein
VSAPDEPGMRMSPEARGLLHAAQISAGAIRSPRLLTATVIAVYDDGHTEVHSVARGSGRTKLVIDLGDGDES